MSHGDGRRSPGLFPVPGVFSLPFVFPTVTGAITSILEYFETLRSSKNTDGMRRYGIRFREAYGIQRTQLRALARALGRDTALARELWRQDVHECYLLAVLVADPRDMTPALMDEWVGSLYSWDICDSACTALFRRCAFAPEKIGPYAADRREFVRRTAFSLIVAEAVHRKKAPDEAFYPYLDLIEQHAGDDRNFVRKAVCWALRAIGKRDLHLHERALALAGRLVVSGNRAAVLTGRETLRELNDPRILNRIKA